VLRVRAEVQFGGVALETGLFGESVELFRAGGVYWRAVRAVVVQH
jgi:hypothetical protein